MSKIIDVGKGEEEEYFVQQIMGQKEGTSPRPNADSAGHLRQVYSDSCKHLDEGQKTK